MSDTSEPWRPLKRLGVATHNDQFLGPVLDATGQSVVVRRDLWQGHGLHHQGLSKSVAEWADVVLAEWCLGNAVWHSQRKQNGKRLLVRFHRFELETDFPAKVDIEAVDGVVFVGPHIRDRAIEALGWPREKCVVVPNMVNTAVFDLPKPEAARFTLGLLTWHRQLKRLDRALDVLEALRAEDSRYTLRIKGARPEDMASVWKYEVERDYFTKQYQRIANSDHLKDAVSFDPPGPDVPEWFQMIGHVLSFSDVESFHLAAAEGMASRSVPVIIDRDGAREVFDGRWVVADTNAAVRAISAYSEVRSWQSGGQSARVVIQERYDPLKVRPAWRALLIGDVRQGEFA